MIKLDLRPTDRMLRTFGLIGLIVFGIFALTLWLWGRIVFIPLPGAAQRPVMYVCLALAAWCALGSAAAPRILQPLYVVLTLISYPIGLVMSYLILGFLFYVVLTPIGLFFRLIGRDAMTRKFEPALATYWVQRRPPADARRYFRQF
jgi:hypothetical protein